MNFKSQVKRCYQSCRHFRFARPFWTAVFVIVCICVLGGIFSPHGSIASKVFAVLLGLTVGGLFVLAGGYIALTGLFMFFERQSLRVAVYSLVFCLAFGAFIAVIGVEGVLRVVEVTMSPNT